MSIDLMRQVYERQTDATTQRVLLVLCDHANDDGHCWPSIPLIAWKLDCSERTVIRLIGRLEADGVIAITRESGKPNHYQIDLSALPLKASRPLTKRHPGQIVTPDKLSQTPDKVTPHPRQNDRGTRDTAMSPEPPVEPPVNHQQNHQRRAQPKSTRANTADGRAYALVDAFAIATKKRPNQIQGRDRSEAVAAFRPYVEDATPDDVIGCVAYLRSDSFWRAPGKLTARKVAATLPEWIAEGRPAAIPARASPNGRPSVEDEIERNTRAANAELARLHQGWP